MPRVKLTKRSIDALPRPMKDVVYWDSGCPGFGLKVTPKGERSSLCPIAGRLRVSANMRSAHMVGSHYIYQDRSVPRRSQFDGQAITPFEPDLANAVRDVAYHRPLHLMKK
jgi:hypothetical protein